MRIQRSLLLFLAIVDLGFTYLTYDSQQYFSPLAMPLNLLLPLLSLLLFLLPFSRPFNNSKHKNAMVIAATIASLLLILANTAYGNPHHSLFSIAAGNLKNFPYVALAAVLTLAALFLIGKAAARIRGKAIRYPAVLVLLVFASAIAYVSMFGLNSNSGWVGVDELAYNYYASYLSLHGTNPYTQSMQPILEERGTPASLLLNGSYEYAYDYPAMSFLPYVPIVALGIRSLFSFVAALIFLCVLSAFILYWKSGCNNELLLPLAAWLYFSYSVIMVSNAFLAVSVFLLLAYLYRTGSRSPRSSSGLRPALCSSLGSRSRSSTCSPSGSREPGRQPSR